MTAVMIPPEWHQDALCWYAIRTNQALPDDWYAPPTDPAHRAAKAICGQCPVKRLCDAQGAGESHGLWGGEYREHQPANIPIRHGTTAGETQHRRNREKVCDACAAARAEYERLRVRKKVAA